MNIRELLESIDWNSISEKIGEIKLKELKSYLSISLLAYSFILGRHSRYWRRRR